MELSEGGYYDDVRFLCHDHIISIARYAGQLFYSGSWATLPWIMALGMIWHTSLFYHVCTSLTLAMEKVVQIRG